MTFFHGRSLATSPQRVLFGLALPIGLALSCSAGDGTLDAGIPVFDGVFRACESDLDCGDRIACTIDHCVDGRCTHDACPDCCPDGLACVEGLGCRTAPEPCTEDTVCADDIPCTIDRCRDATYCEHLPQDELCVTGESCLPALGCIPTPPTTCDTEADCTVGRECLGVWSCQPEFGCQFISPPDCDDADDCTDDVCVESEGGCTHPVRDQDDDGYGDAMCGADDCQDMSATIYPGAEETCNALDDDCDGTIDESCCETGNSCLTTCGSMGTTTCNPDGSLGPCAPPTETCSGVDDDCDGNVDEGSTCRAGERDTTCMTGCGSTGARVCSATCAWEACMPPTETCNGVDDDCDGEADDGFACVRGVSSACTTTCASMGSRVCLGDCSFDTCVPPAEVCNGVDDDCDSAIDDGFMCPRGSMRTCMTSCGSTGSQTCNTSCRWAACTPPAEGCNGVDDDCDMLIDETSECTPGGSRACTTACGSTGRQACGATCTYGTCTPPAEICNGADDNCNGACDETFMCCRGATRACSTLGFPSGTAVCRNDCSGFDTSTCSQCGNGMINGTEQCDGANLNGQTCASRGFGGGTLRCTSSCTFDTSMCSTFDPSGIYDNVPAPTYVCAFGLVNYSIGTFVFSDSGSSLIVSGAPCTMTGPSARVSRMINVTCTLPGTCDEVYSLTGTFTSDTVWTGTFTANFVGSCFECTLQTTSVTGTKR